MPVAWEEASPTVMSTAQYLIENYHPDLVEANILFMFRSEPALVSGRVAYSKSQKVSAQMRTLLEDAHFIIWVVKEAWEAQSEEWRQALLDHELQHCGMEDGEPYLRPHDIEEFQIIIERHGLWSVELLKTAHSIRQLSLLPENTEIRYAGRVFTTNPQNLSKSTEELQNG
jgi:hypothetical protein